MRIVLQRVRHARVSVDNQEIARIGPGLVILIGIGPDDGEEQAGYLSEKIANLRIFEDQDGKINRSLLDVGGELSWCRNSPCMQIPEKDAGPSFTDAADPQVAQPLVERFAALLVEQGVPTQTGEFGAHMLVEIANDGPVTIYMER